MSVIKLTFKGYPSLELAINNSSVGTAYYELVKLNYQHALPIFRDRVNYTVDRMLELAQQAKQSLGWDWVKDTYDVSTATQLHKNIETTLANGFEDVAEEHDELLHEIHYCLHAIQGNQTGRCGWLQIEWYNDQGFDLDQTFTFASTMKFGDIKLQNPWVGHPPLTIFQEQDNTNILQTCKFHNFVKPGINIVLEDFSSSDSTQVLDYFNKHAPEFVALHGAKKILHYLGYPVIGAVTNLSVLEQIVAAPALAFESLEFIDD